MSAVHLSTIGSYRPVPNYEGYFVTEDGRVFSRLTSGAPVRVANGKGQARTLPDGLVRGLGTYVGSSGYPVVTLRGRQFLVHRLVLEAFVGLCPLGMECRHLDGIRTNNSLDNLRWGTKKENRMDSVRHGTLGYGESHWKAKLTEAIIRKVRRLNKDGMSQAALARRFGVAKVTIWNVISKKTWRHVS